MQRTGRSVQRSDGVFSGVYSLWRGDRKLGDIDPEKPDGGSSGNAVGGTLLPTTAMHGVEPVMQVSHADMPTVQHPMAPIPLDAQQRRTPAPHWLAAPSQEEAIDTEDVVDVPDRLRLEIRSSDGTPIAAEAIGLACWLIPPGIDLREIERHWGTRSVDGRLWKVVVKFAQF